MRFLVVLRITMPDRVDVSWILSVPKTDSSQVFVVVRNILFCYGLRNPAKPKLRGSGTYC